MVKPKKESANDNSSQALAEKWGRNAMAYGFTALPNAVLYHAKELGLTRTDVLVAFHLASYWWAPDSKARPSKKTLADALDLDPRTIQRSIARMEKLNLVRRKERKAKAGDNLPNFYFLDGLAKKAEEISKRELKVREQRRAEDSERTSTPKTALRLVRDDEED